MPGSPGDPDTPGGRAQLTREKALVFARAVRNMGPALAGEAWQPALRLLDLLRRDKVLAKAAARAAREALDQSPLRELRVNGTPFHLPVCFADAPPEVWSRAAALAAKGIPLGLERGADGRRRGLPWDDVLAAANEEGLVGRRGTAGEVDALDLLDWIDAATRAVPKRLREHPHPNLARIPQLRDRIELAVRRLIGCELREACDAYGKRFDEQLAAAGTRFAAWIDARVLAELFTRAATRAMTRAASGGEASVSLGGVGVFEAAKVADGRAKERPSVVCGDLQAPASWGTGSGAAIVRVEDLQAAARTMADAAGRDDRVRAILLVGDPGWLVVAVDRQGRPATEACQFRFTGLE